ncbi:phosphatase PAP2 family protein [Fictibacillus iocasae]|uniref:Phosphatase PAP2 family protein n=1 Tax=Fictibacillus iocasae TaxID=2715437 RepID=A0ABW2NRW4_9BACL
MIKMMGWIYEKECVFFRLINDRMQHRMFDAYFRRITHAGGATFSILSVILLALFMPHDQKPAAYACMFSLLVSHLPVAVAKKCYPRKRPYLALPGTRTTENPLKDHSFPSGHTTAVFSVVTPLALLFPITCIFLLPLAVSVGLSRMYLGLHYPTDVLAGFVLGTSSGFFSLFLMKVYAVPYFL